MLKPKRKITRDEIKKDSFVESVFEVRSFVKENLKLFYQIGGGIALFFLLIIFLGQSSKNNKLEAEFLLTQSTLYLDGGDVQNAKILLQELVDEYDGTEAGRLGGYHLAQLYIRDNDNELALPLLIKYSKSGDNPFLLSSSNEAIASMYMQINNLKKIESAILKVLANYFEHFKDKRVNFIKNKPKKFKFISWSNILEKEGHNIPHIHPSGWVSGVLYIQMPNKIKNDEAGIQFHLEGDDFISTNKNCPKKSISPSVGDVVLFPSSLFHSTVPFNSNEKRICIAFDLCELE